MVLLWILKILMVIALVRFQAVSGRALFSVTVWTVMLAGMYLLGTWPFWLLGVEALLGAIFFGLLQRYQHDWRWYPTLFFGTPFVVII
jgi:hypothetical protein